jgi:hypothetical protein
MAIYSLKHLPLIKITDFLKISPINLEKIFFYYNIIYTIAIKIKKIIHTTLIIVQNIAYTVEK